MALQPFAESWTPFRFVILDTVDKTPWTWDQPVAKAFTYTQDNTKLINALKYPYL
jgi:hypothetical protein